MSATYDTTLATDRDHVRFLIGDTVVTNAKLSDEEIDAVLDLETATGEALPYFAAARCLEALRSRWLGAGAGVLEKSVGELTLRYGGDQSSAATLETAIKDLRKRGATLLAPSPKVFRAV